MITGSYNHVQEASACLIKVIVNICTFYTLALIIANWNVIIEDHFKSTRLWKVNDVFSASNTGLTLGVICFRRKQIL